LSLRSDYPLSPIYSTKNLAKKVAQDQETDDRVSFVGRNNETAVLGKIAINIKSFGAWYRKQLDELNELQRDLFGGIDFVDEEWISLTVPEELVDEVNVRRPGFCFLDLEFNGMKKYEEAGLRTLFHHPRLKDRFGCVLPCGRFILNPAACHDFLKRSEFARTKLATLLHLGGGGAARGTEFTANYLRNHPQGDIRNVKVIDGELCLVGGYNKSSSIVSLLSQVLSWSPLVADISFNLDREAESDLSLHPKKPLRGLPR